MPCFFVPPLPLAVGTNVTTNVPASSAPVYNAASTYAKGAVVIDAVTRFEYESLIANNTNKPLSDATAWISRGIENRGKMFDVSIGSQTINPNEIVIQLDVRRVVTTLTLLNVEAASVEVTINDPIEGAIPYNGNQSLIEPSGGKSWFNWHFAPVQREDRALFDGLPTYSQAIITIKIKNPGSVAKCGVLLIGKKVILGESAYGTSVSIDDYSVKKRDDFGGWNVLEGEFSETCTLPVQVSEAMLDKVPRILAKYRATACFYVGAEMLKSTWIYGYFERFQHVFSDFGIADCNIELESLT